MADPSSNHKSNSKAVDVGAQQVAIVYAKAFLGAAEQAGQTDALVEELHGLTTALEKFPDFEAVLASALVSGEEKSAVLDRVFASKASGTILDFLKVLGSHGRLNLLRAVEQEVARLHDQLRGRLRVQVRTATAVDDALANNLRGSLQTLFGAEPKLDAQVDPALIGGIMLRVGDTVYDGSVARQLDQVRQQMINRSVHEIQSRRDRFRHSGGD
jgi:F-type H+-transporting ATPase subunit delta